MPTARGFAGASVVGGKIFVLGGYEGDGALATNEAYQPTQDGPSAWEELAELPNQRYGMGVVGLADTIYVMGGIDDNLQAVEPIAYISQSDTWQSLESPPLILGYNLGLVSQGSYLYAIGGRDQSGPKADTLAYQAIFIVSFPVIVK